MFPRAIFHRDTRLLEGIIFFPKHEPSLKGPPVSSDSCALNPLVLVAMAATVQAPAARRMRMNGGDDEWFMMLL